MHEYSAKYNTVLQQIDRRHRSAGGAAAVYRDRARPHAEYQLYEQSDRTTVSQSPIDRYLV